MIFIKATIRCDGWHGSGCEAVRTSDSPTRLAATEEATLSVDEGTISDVNANECEHPILQISSKPDGWDVQQDGRVKCPTCIKDEAQYRQAKYQRDKTEAEKKKEAAIKRGLAKMRGPV